MHDTGLSEVVNPSEIFLSEHSDETTGSVVEFLKTKNDPVKIKTIAHGAGVTKRKAFAVAKNHPAVCTIKWKIFARASEAPYLQNQLRILLQNSERVKSGSGYKAPEKRVGQPGAGQT